MLSELSTYKAPKPNQDRIALLDGRELQYHVPRHLRAAPKHLYSQIPALNGRPLEVEIGPGKGEFLAARAAAYPDHFFVGIDRRKERFELTEKKLQRNSTNNSCVLQEDARAFIDAGLPPIQILHVYQPDPWPKTRHHKHRFFRSPEARAWATAIVPGGELRFSTDHRGYFEEIMDIVLSWEHLECLYVFDKNSSFCESQSHFENIFLKKKLPVYKAFFRRTI